MEYYLNYEIALLLGWTDLERGIGPEVTYSGINPEGEQQELPDWSGEFWSERHPYELPDIAPIMALIDQLITRQKTYLMIERHAVRIGGIGLARSLDLAHDLALLVKLVLKTKE